MLYYVQLRNDKFRTFVADIWYLVTNLSLNITNLEQRAAKYKCACETDLPNIDPVRETSVVYRYQNNKVTAMELLFLID